MNTAKPRSPTSIEIPWLTAAVSWSALVNIPGNSTDRVRLTH